MSLSESKDDDNVVTSEYSTDDDDEEYDPFFKGILEKPKVTVIIGSCASGKTYFLKYVMLELLKQGIYKFGRVFSKTCMINDDYSYIPQKCLTDDISKDSVNAYIKKLIDLKKKRKEEGKAMPRNFVIFDDACSVLQKIYYDPDSKFSNFSISHRHFGTDIFILSQSVAHGISTILQQIFNNLIMFNTSNIDSLKVLYKLCGAEKFNDYKEFGEVLQRATQERYYCLACIKEDGVAKFYPAKAGEIEDKDYVAKF